MPIRISAMDYGSLFLSNFNIMMVFPVLALLVSLTLHVVSRLNASDRLYRLSKHLLKEYFLTFTMFNLYNITFSAGLQFLYSHLNVYGILSVVLTGVSLMLPLAVLMLLVFSGNSEFG